jgi:hypothetical protein
VPPDSVRCTREFHSKLATFGNSGRPLRYNSPDCPVCQAEQRSSAPTVVCRGIVKRYSARLRAQKSEQAQKAHRTLNRTCLVAPLSEAPTVGTQRSGDVAGAPDSVRWRTGLSGGAPDCPVRHTTEAFTNGHFGGCGYKYPPTTTLQCIQVFSHQTSYKSYRLHSKAQRDQILSQVRNHSKQISD